jgi:hypothetical protein
LLQHFMQADPLDPERIMPKDGLVHRLVRTTVILAIASHVAEEALAAEPNGLRPGVFVESAPPAAVPSGLKPHRKLPP